jgi:hypothetical protein
MAANHLTTAVSELPDYIAKNRNISALGHSNPNEGTTGDTSSSIHNADGTIKLGYIPNWRSLSNADHDKVKEERKRLGLQKGAAKKGNSSAANSNRMKQLQAQNKKYKRTIKSLKRSSKAADTDDDSNDDDIDAGDQFGGRVSKKKTKKKKSP